MENDDKFLQYALAQLVHRASTGSELDIRVLKAIKTIKAEKGHIICSYKVPVEASDKDGYWQVGAISTLADNVCAVAVFSVSGHAIFVRK